MNLRLWTEKYRPQTLDDYIWRDEGQRRKVEEWIAQGALPHLMFFGPAGVGKTSLAKLLLREINIPAGDILEINASRERKVDDIQTYFENFVRIHAINPSDIKYILFDEADSMSAAAQRMLRTDMETYSDYCRIIFTCNSPERIIQPIHDRCQQMSFMALDRAQFTARIISILRQEAVAFEVKDLEQHIHKSYPSMRNCINSVHSKVINGRLIPPRADEARDPDYLCDIVAHIQANMYHHAKELIVAQVACENYPEVYRFFYQNLGMFSPVLAKQEDAVLIISKFLIQHETAACKDINLAACLIELSRI